MPDILEAEKYNKIFELLFFGFKSIKLLTHITPSKVILLLGKGGAVDAEVSFTHDIVIAEIVQASHRFLSLYISKVSGTMIDNANYDDLSYFFFKTASTYENSAITATSTPPI